MEDNVTHPKHYAGVPATVECIDITRHLPFALGNAVKYLWRAGKKGGPEQEIEDLEKAQWYLDDWAAWREHLTNVDLSVAYTVFRTILPDGMEGFRGDAIYYILCDNTWDAENVIGDWLRDALKRRQSK